MINQQIVRLPRQNIGGVVNSTPFKLKKDLRFPKISKFVSRTPRLDLNQTQIVELPDIFRNNTPSPSKIVPSSKHFTYERSLNMEKNSINAESIISQEEKLSKILELLDNPTSNIQKQLIDYWNISNNEALWALDKLFKDTRVRRAILNSLIIESLAISLLIFCNDRSMIHSNLNNQLKTMAFCVYQNLLTIIDLLLTKISPKSESNPWVVALQTCLEAKKKKNLKRSEHSTYLKHNSDVISNCIRTVIHLFPSNSSPNIAILSHILANLDKYSVSSARTYLSPMKNFSENISPPFLPSQSTKKLTLVLDLDETLVHYSGHRKSGELLIRPYCSEFLEEMNKFYEIVVFTAGIQEYADWAIDIADFKKFVKFRLYRQHTVQSGGSFIKDLSKLGREIAKIIIVDNVAANFQLQKENGILIKTWIGDPKDKELAELSKKLTGSLYLELANIDTGDIRNALKNL